MLKIGLPQAVGHLHFLWWWTLEYAQNGKLSAFSHDEIAIAAKWENDPAEFISALISCNFLDDNPMQIHDWYDFAGKLVVRRMSDARRKRVLRTSCGRRKDGVRTQPNPTKPNLTKRKKEEDLSPAQKCDMQFSPRFSAAEQCWKSAMVGLGRSTVIDIATKLILEKIATDLIRLEYTEKQLVAALKDFYKKRESTKDMSLWGLAAFYNHKADFIKPEAKEQPNGESGLPQMTLEERNKARESGLERARKSGAKIAGWETDKTDTY